MDGIGCKQAKIIIMSDPVIPVDNQEPTKRFRRILNTTENKDIDHLDIPEPESGEVKPPELKPEEIPDATSQNPQTETTEQQSESPSIQSEDKPVDTDGAGLSPEQIPVVTQEVTSWVSINSPVSEEKTQQTILAIDEYGMPLPGRINRNPSRPGTINPIPAHNLQSQPTKKQPIPDQKPKTQSGS